MSRSLKDYIYFRWSELSLLKTGRVAFALKRVRDGRLFVVGGQDGPNSPLTSVETLQCPWDTEDPGNSEWQFVAPMHHARVAHALAYFVGKLIAAGGKEQDSVERFTLVRFQKASGSLYDQ